MIEIYTDGSSAKNRAGWGFIALVDGVKVYEKAGIEHPGDTNQLMELIAVMEACNWAEGSDYFKDNDVTIYSDSAYVINCYQDKWYINWENNGWKNTRGEKIANLLEWRFLIKFFKKPNFDFRKIKGHSGHIYNERADALAQGKIQPDKNIYLTNSKKNDKIYIEVSDIFLNYSMKKITIKDAIMKVVEIIKREGNIDE